MAGSWGRAGAGADLPVGWAPSPGPNAARRPCRVGSALLLAGLLLSFVGPAGAASAEAPLLASAGDIACDPKHPSFNNGKGRYGFGPRGQCRQLATSRLLKGARRVLALGDNQYEHGSLANFRRSYHLSWGRYRPITKAVIGNHEYGPPPSPNLGADGYWDYFGAKRAGPRDRGWHAFSLGGWRIIVLNSQCHGSSIPRHMQPMVGCGANSPQGRWLRRELARSEDRQCILAAWHHPRFSSRGNFTEVTSFWRALERAGADVVLSGHVHHYERFRPRAADGRPTEGAPRQFVVGTGGKSIDAPPPKVSSHAQRFARVHGVLRLRLHRGAYGWRFIRAGNGAVLDRGSAACTAPR